jgi:hypothetical protein
MPLALLIPAIIGALAEVMASLVGRVLLALFISYVTFTGIDAINTSIVGAVKSNLAGVGGDTVSFLAYLWVDKAISMVLSAYLAAVAMKVTAGSITNMVIKK